MPKIGFVTCHPTKLKDYYPTIAEPNFLPTEPPFTPDDQLAVNTLRELGHSVEAIIWGCPIEQLKQFAGVIVRSPWDYMDTTENRTAFMHWITTIADTGITILNPPKMMEWLLDKHYLDDYHKKGINVIPTQYLPKAVDLNLAAEYQSRGEPFVLKPCISAAGIGLFFIDSLETAVAKQTAFTEQLKKNDYMLQDFVPEIRTHGEWSLIFLGGKYSHAVHKKPGNESILVHAEQGGSLNFNTQPSSHIIEFAKTVFSKIDHTPVLYLRIDIIDTSTGPTLIECEGVEPELFFRAQPASVNLFCHSISKLLLEKHARNSRITY
jgi:glutathione synthase/RimK-type ligase-like ATP-grasp enzyme